MSIQVPFFEYPRLWSDDREEFLSIIDNVSSSDGYSLIDGKKSVKTKEQQVYIGNVSKKN